MSMRAGAFIVIEGVDGAGKSTQFALLHKRLQAAGHDVVVYKFPRIDQPSSHFVRRYLQGEYGRADDVGPYTTSLFYALDRYEAARDIGRALDAGKVVLCDRFTGSNMAHQGTKLAHAEERRGFFIWLDNLEFEMLKIPRPDLSLVLRVPAEIAKANLHQKPGADVHETNASHIERTVVVYDDLTQLFPKDFQRIDCVRGDALLDADTIHTMLWEKVSPLLPAPSSEKSPFAAGVTQPAPAAEPSAQPVHFVLENASSLLQQKLQSLVPGTEITATELPAVYMPQSLAPATKATYQTQMDALLGLHSRILQGLAVRGVDHAQAAAVARLVLPAAATTTVRIPSNQLTLEQVLTELLSSDLPEIQAAGATLMAQALKADPQALAAAINADHTKRQPIKQLATQFLTANHSDRTAPVELTYVWPRNELDIVADILYPHADAPLRTIQASLQSWPYERKLSILETYLQNEPADPALEATRYHWDCLCPYDVLLELQRQPAEGLALQPLTPRHGYDTPAIIDNADLDELFEQAFDTSLALYSTLQQAGHQVEAQYAVLHGHNTRWKLATTGRQLQRLLAAPAASTHTQDFLNHLQRKLNETHPIVGEAFKRN